MVAAREPHTFLPKEELLYSEIERLTGSFRCHRRALDFDRGFVNSVLKEEELGGEDPNEEM